MGNKDKGHVIKIGEDLFRSQDYFNTGTEEILWKSDYPRSSFYHHFTSRESFAAQVLEQYGNDEKNQRNNNDEI